MSRFKDKINSELGYLKATGTAQDIINKTERTNKVITFKRAVAMVAILVLVFTIIFIPSNNPNGSFVIIVNAESAKSGATPDSDTATGDELNTESFVELKSEEPNYIYYNFNYILDENAEDTDLVRKYLFHSFDKILNIRIEGENIATITYKINNGSLTSYTFKVIDASTTEYHLDNTTGGIQSQITLDYEKQVNTSFFLNPISSSVDHYDYENEMLWVLKHTGEITKDTIDAVYNEDGEIIDYSSNEIIGCGYRDTETLATKEEIVKLREYIKNNDMVGFHNYQNKIFKRIIENITVDVTITKTNGDTETKTLEFLYTPESFRESQLAYYDTTQSVTMSAGTLSARIK